MNLVRTARSAAFALVAFVGGVASLTSLAACGASPDARAPSASKADALPMVADLSPPSSRIGLRRSVVADEYFWLRAKLLDGDAPAAFSEAVDAMHELHAAFAGDVAAWEDLEVPLGAVEHASELVAIYGALPETTDEGPELVRLRSLALRLARALAATERAYAEGPYREHHAAITRAAEVLASKLVPVDARVAGAIEGDWDLAIPDRPIVLTLVGDAPYPGSFAGDARGRAIASFVRVRGLDGADLVEVLLQQYLHTLDEITVRAPTLPNELRQAFARREVDASDPNVEMAVNTMAFAEAASLVRRFVDPSHVPLGEGGFYAFYPPAPAIVDAWNRRIAGEASAVTVEAIVDGALGP